jgi:aminopeptidase-like protein
MSHITGNGVSKTLSCFQRLPPNLEIFEAPTGTKAFDCSGYSIGNLFSCPVLA